MFDTNNIICLYGSTFTYWWTQLMYKFKRFSLISSYVVSTRTLFLIVVHNLQCLHVLFSLVLHFLCDNDLFKFLVYCSWIYMLSLCIFVWVFQCWQGAVFTLFTLVISLCTVVGRQLLLCLYICEFFWRTYVSLKTSSHLPGLCSTIAGTDWDVTSEFGPSARCSEAAHKPFSNRQTSTLAEGISYSFTVSAGCEQWSLTGL